MSELLEIAPSKFTNYAVEFTENEVKEFVSHDTCPTCQSKNNRTAVELGAKQWDTAIKVNQCADCAHIFYGNSPSIEWTLNYYKQDWMQEDDTKKAATTINPGFKVADLLGSIPQYKDQNTNIFDVGCGPGVLLKGLKERGYNNLYGCEQSPIRRQTANAQFNDRIFDGGYQDVIMDQKFDVIYSNHVLEHIFTPLDYIKWCKEHLNDQGIIATFVPNAEYESVFGQTFFLPHIHSFTYSSLEALGKQHGFKTVFWTGCRHDEICAIFYKDEALIPKQAAFVQCPNIQKRNADDLFSRLQAPWFERSNDNSPVILTYHIPNLVKSEKTVWRSYARLSQFGGWYIRFIRNAAQIAFKKGMKNIQRRLPLFLKLISSQEHQVKTLGYVRIQNEAQDTETKTPRVSYKGKALLLLK